MAAYIIARIEVTDPARYPDYTARTPGLIARFGGRFIVRGGAVRTLEGADETRRVVVIEFPDVASARTFYDSPDYQAVIGIRHEAARSELILVEGA